MQKTIINIRRSSANNSLLEKIKVGDLVSDEFGKSGKVKNIERIEHSREVHYYFHLDKAGTLLIIV
ncbi:hypothetical protein [Pedobacter rhizosphaerae]|uniref:Uncharacterized protein n=1 Tax=Pedobacter rhizosphaerae TaxID=390241 RepID=A0A1H9VJN4_9SPHI|nr:hypothetical protein [Pedobacter rhizosphaerae]SES21794.1 hypothetical protein SAMN04488023_1441 [Pedobacter rhizosphaerae]